VPYESSGEESATRQFVMVAGTRFTPTGLGRKSRIEFGGQQNVGKRLGSGALGSRGCKVSLFLLTANMDYMP
jgi:hypothetical protein